ncbi:MAG: iron ABC transporter permease [Phycisphaerales bacterium]|nr:iron ABC transporter permease [Phycisphaerales bacterium]
MAFVAVFLVVPVWQSIHGAVHDAEGWTLFHVIDVFRDPQLRRGLANSLIIATFTTAVASAIAIPAAMLTSRCAFFGKGLFSVLLLAPLILPPFVGAIGMEAIVGRTGSFNAILLALGVLDEPLELFAEGGMSAIIVLEALHLYPILWLNLAASLSNIDPALDEAARNLGASPWQRFRRVTLPLIRPGFFAGATIVFVWSFTELGTPLMFQFRTVTSVQIFDGLKEIESSRQPYALTLVMFVIATGVYLLGKFTLGRSRGSASTKASVRRVERPLSGVETTLAWALLGGVCFLACIPHIGVILSAISLPGGWYDTILPQSFTIENFTNALQHPLAAGAIRNSLVLAGSAVLIDVLIGIAAARILVRTTLPGRWLLDVLVMLPIAVPGLVLAFGYISMSLSWPFAQGGPLAFAGNIMGADPNPFPFLIAAYAMRRLPYVVRATVAGLEQTPVDLEEAAASAGAKPLRIVRKIVVPLVMANVMAGALLAFSFSMLEVSDSLLLAQREGDFPVTKAIYTLYDRLGDGPAIASAMGTWAMLLLGATLVAVSSMLGKRMGAMFRG